MNWQCKKLKPLEWRWARGRDTSVCRLFVSNVLLPNICYMQWQCKRGAEKNIFAPPPPTVWKGNVKNVYADIFLHNHFYILKHMHILKILKRRLTESLHFFKIRPQIVRLKYFWYVKNYDPIFIDEEFIDVTDWHENQQWCVKTFAHFSERFKPYAKSQSGKTAPANKIWNWCGAPKNLVKWCPQSTPDCMWNGARKIHCPRP